MTGKETGVQVAHFFTRKNLHTRWDVDNACLLSAGKHLYFAHVEHEKFRDWYIKRIGQDRFDALKMRANYVGGTVSVTTLKEWNYLLIKTLEE